jgi:hypothetical protein
MGVFPGWRDHLADPIRWALPEEVIPGHTPGHTVGGRGFCTGYSPTTCRISGQGDGQREVGIPKRIRLPVEESSQWTPPRRHPLEFPLQDLPRVATQPKAPGPGGETGQKRKGPGSEEKLAGAGYPIAGASSPTRRRPGTPHRRGRCGGTEFAWYIKGSGKPPGESHAT